MVGREDLHARPDLSAVADRDSTTSRITQLKFRKAPAPVEAVVAVERRPDHRAVPDGREAFQ